MHRGQRLVDAAVMEPVPVNAAAADGCTHVLVLCERTLLPPGDGAAGSSPFDEEGTGYELTGIVERERKNEQQQEREKMLLRGRFFSRVRDFINRRRQAMNSEKVQFDGGTAGVSVSDTSNTVAGGTGASCVPSLVQHVNDTSSQVEEVENYETEISKERRKRNGGLSKAINGMLYRTIRNALLNPPHTKDAWAVADAAHSLIDDNYTTVRALSGFNPQLMKVPSPISDHRLVDYTFNRDGLRLNLLNKA